MSVAQHSARRWPVTVARHLAGEQPWAIVSGCQLGGVGVRRSGLARETRNTSPSCFRGVSTAMYPISFPALPVTRHDVMSVPDAPHAASSLNRPPGATRTGNL